MRKNYCLPEETVTECPICSKLLLEGSGMTRKEKAIRRLKGLPNYKNLPKHIVGHADEESKHGISPTNWKMWDQAKQVKWIMDQAAEYLMANKPNYKLEEYGGE